MYILVTINIYSIYTVKHFVKRQLNYLLGNLNSNIKPNIPCARRLKCTVVYYFYSVTIYSVAYYLNNLGCILLKEIE